MLQLLIQNIQDGTSASQPFGHIVESAEQGIELLMRYFVGTELGVSNLLQRHFDWVSNTLWFEEIPNGRDPSKTLFLLGGQDDIIHAEV